MCFTYFYHRYIESNQFLSTFQAFAPAHKRLFSVFFWLTRNRQLLLLFGCCAVVAVHSLYLWQPFVVAFGVCVWLKTLEYLNMKSLKRLCEECFVNFCGIFRAICEEVESEEDLQNFWTEFAFLNVKEFSHKTVLIDSKPNCLKIFPETFKNFDFRFWMLIYFDKTRFQ